MCNLCLGQLDYFVMWQNRSHPGSKLPFIRGDVHDLVLLVQDQFLCGVEQRFERLEVGVPASEQVVILPCLFNLVLKLVL